MAAIIQKDPALVARLRTRLLDWYDAHGRDLPWRHGARDPYRVWLSEVMLQQTTVAHMMRYYERFLVLWPRVCDLAAAEDAQIMAEWAGLGYYARARKLLECARAVMRDHGGQFPDTEEALLGLPGLGPYTAAAVSAIAFGHPANVVDGNIERIMARVHAIATPLPAGKTDIRAAAAQWVAPERAGDWPQALMDLANLVCRPKAPLCVKCPLNEGCEACRRGEQARYPVKAEKKAKPIRHGVVFLITCGDMVMAEQRAEKGLLGGMVGLPHTPWRAQPWADAEAEKVLADLLDKGTAYRKLGSYEHVFTHFALTQAVWAVTVNAPDAAAVLRRNNALRLVSQDGLKALPTVFAKALRFDPYGLLI